MLRIALSAAPLLLIGANVATGQAVGHRVNVNGMHDTTRGWGHLTVLHRA